METRAADGVHARCRNCGTALAGRYCPACAQDSSLDRLSLPALLRRGIDAFEDLDAPLVKTIVGMTLRPGAVVTEFVEGARRRYTNPIKYALIFGALMVVAIRLDPLGRARLFPEVRSDAPPAVQLIYDMMPSLIEYTQILMLCSAPLLALLLWAFFPRTKRNFAEQCALVFFVYGHTYLLQTPFVLLGAFGTQWSSVALTLVQVFWLCWAAQRFYGGRPWLTFLRALAPHVIFFGFANVLMTVFILLEHGSGVFAPPG